MRREAKSGEKQLSNQEGYKLYLFVPNTYEYLDTWILRYLGQFGANGVQMGCKWYRIIWVDGSYPTSLVNKITIREYNVNN